MLIALLLVLLQVSAGAALLDGTTLVPTTIEVALSTVQPGTIIVISESHGNAEHHQNQRNLLIALAKRTDLPSISVGLEFFEAQYQSLVDQFTAGLMGESDFLKAIAWGSNPFSDYREQALFPKSHGGSTRALNASRALTRKVARTGITSLTAEERALLPTDFQLGNSFYFERFKQVMGDHVSSEALTRYFEAQSIWDETMAESSRSYLRQNSEQVLVILVGDFHAAYGGGLPDRLLARGQEQLLVISQAEAGDTELGPHPQWGPRAQFVWTASSN
jgi:uncharacterized iron-regulated protein